MAISPKRAVIPLGKRTDSIPPGIFLMRIGQLLGVSEAKEKVLLHGQALTNVSVAPFARGNLQGIPNRRTGILRQTVGGCPNDRTYPAPSNTTFTFTTASKLMRTSSLYSFHLAASSALLFGLFSSSIAQAQDRYGSDVPQETASDNHITIGVGGAVLPEFQGSEKYFIQPIPIVDIKQGPFFLNLGDGLGINVIESSNFRAGVSVTPVIGYDADDVPAGIGKLGISAGAHGFVSGTLGGVVGTLSVTAPFAGDADGLFAEAEIEYPVRINDRLLVVPSLRAKWADNKYLRSYFGVNAAQAAASGLPEYAPSSGFQDVGAALSINYRMTDHISVIASAHVTRNLDRVMDSPFTERRWQPSGILGVAYTF